VVLGASSHQWRDAIDPVGPDSGPRPRGELLEIIGGVDAARKIAAVIAANHEYLGRDALHAIDETVRPAPQPRRIIHRHQDEAVAARGRHVAGPAECDVTQPAFLDCRPRHRRDVRQRVSHHRDRRVAAIDHEAGAVVGRKLSQARRQQGSFGRIVALDVDQEPPFGKRVEHLVERRHQADAAAAKRKSLAAIGGVAIADVERLQLRQRVLTRDAVPLGAAVERPVVKHREVPVAGRMDVELDDVGARVECRPHRRQRVLEKQMLRRVDADRRAGVALEPRGIIGLRQTAMGKENRAIRPLEHQPRRIVEKNERHEQSDARGAVLQCLLHALPGCASLNCQSGDNAAGQRGRAISSGTRNRSNRARC
jgi:hypothetical protein